MGNGNISPFGLGGAVTAGIVSAKNRDMSQVSDNLYKPMCN